MKQPARKQVRLYLRFRLLSGPCHLPESVLAGPCQLPKPEPKPIHHTVLDDQPLEHIIIHSHSGPPTCCMHVHQQQSQTCKTGEPPALREVKHPHRDRTSVSRSPSTEQEVSSQFSGYSEEKDISQGIHVNPNSSHASN